MRELESGRLPRETKSSRAGGSEGGQDEFHPSFLFLFLSPTSCSHWERNTLLSIHVWRILVARTAFHHKGESSSTPAFADPADAFPLSSRRPSCGSSAVIQASTLCRAPTPT